MNLPDEALEDGRLVAQAFEGFEGFEGAGEAIGQPAEAGEATVGKFHGLERAQDALGRIEGRCQAGQPFSRKSLGSIICEER